MKRSASERRSDKNLPLGRTENPCDFRTFVSMGILKPSNLWKIDPSVLYATAFESLNFEL